MIHDSVAVASSKGFLWLGRVTQTSEGKHSQSLPGGHTTVQRGEEVAAPDIVFTQTVSVRVVQDLLFCRDACMAQSNTHSESQLNVCKSHNRACWTDTIDQKAQVLVMGRCDHFERTGGPTA